MTLYRLFFKIRFRIKTLTTPMKMVKTAYIQGVACSGESNNASVAGNSGGQ
jgi:hypothetical protein